ncbi:hypothetical protein [Lactobacillus sp. 3B(2020)]|uniref:hypothetical protein n=1 Tax=Lactobacillus sp. 3B(2020) TaxID=2695882 RepID=UPI0015DEE096|nr:hypothetical protein [Lactobacillus sp. 3B(2020)]QLL69572.1 hypothetical protein GTO83_02960 [Lactobacillus sp. 3B(2020)]
MNKGEYINQYLDQLYEMAGKIAEMQEQASDMKDQVEEMRNQILKGTHDCVFTGAPSTFKGIDNASWELKDSLNNLERDRLDWIGRTIEELSGEIYDLNEEDY